MSMPHLCLASALLATALGCGGSSESTGLPTPAPEAAFLVSNASPLAGQAVSFTDTSTGSPTAWSWDFGDGAASTLQNPSHTWTSPGSFTVRLTAKNAGGTSTASRSLTVRLGVFTLASDAALEGGWLPADCTCDGSGASPALSWADAPSGTQEFVLMMTTLPGDGTTKWNWVIYGIPASVSALPRNATGIGILGNGSHGTTACYDPPCSQGPGAKIYTFTLYALSASPRPAGTVTGETLTQAIAPHILGTATLNLNYARP